ncbi:hypothetical protein HNR23_001269 [Nocardiopsis mwathae]|uniref:Uncharacterized protein n=1 Tax=Nocardiopsis mwathae TaxID=1472723 RepID=A0A7W9YFN5_9ACTN|nr:hypothetical protein [Nocardiopsis mwathae]MBB6171209.1 hypothetical protein [Nocardiopsis mwathae]
MLDSPVLWVIMFGLPIIVIVTIVSLAYYHTTEVQDDGRDDEPSGPTEG